MASELPARLSYEDATFLYFDREQFPYNVGSVGIYEGVIPFEDYISHVDRRLDRVPRYRQRLVPVPFDIARPAWHDDPDFAIEQHVSHDALPAPGDDAQLRRMAAEFFATPLDRNKPLWEIRLVHGLSGNRTAHLAKIHHCLVDGISGVQLLGALLDVEAHPSDEPLASTWARPQSLPGRLARMTDAFFDRALEQIDAAAGVARAVTDPASAARAVRDVAGSVLASRDHLFHFSRAPWSTRLTSPKRMAWVSLPFEDVRRMSKALGGSVNDTVLAVLAGGLGRYLRHHGFPTDERIRVLIPVNVRGSDEARNLGNRVSFMLAGLPVGVRDPARRFDAIHAEISHLKEIDQAAHVDRLAAFLGSSSPRFQRLLGERLSLPNFVGDLVCTNVPGPKMPLYSAGHRMVDHYPWVPIGWRMGLGVAVMSYDTQLSITLTADLSVMADLERLGTAIEDEFAAMRDAIGGEPVAALPSMYRTQSEPAPANGAAAGHLAPLSNGPADRTS